jgi:serine/threonine protein kinase
MTERVQTTGAASPSFEVTIGGKYRIESLVGEGGFARVYRARHAKIRQLVFAVKILRKQQVDDPTQIERFVREAEMSATLQSPYAVRVTDFGETRQGLPYIVMEYVKGRTLHDWVHKFGQPDDRFAAQIALCILRALEEAHSRGIVHRDLKPSNIMVLDEPAEDGIVAKVTDFGIAKVISPSQAGLEESPPTTGGLVFCTPQYASPEVLMGNPTFQSDLYALGHTLAEMLDGKSPFAGWGSFEIANRQMTPESTLFGEPTMQSALAPIIERACLKDLSRRYASATEMAKEVEKLLTRLDRTTPVEQAVADEDASGPPSVVISRAMTSTDETTQAMAMGNLPNLNQAHDDGTSAMRREPPARRPTPPSLPAGFNAKAPPPPVAPEPAPPTVAQRTPAEALLTMGRLPDAPPIIPSVEIPPAAPAGRHTQRISLQPSPAATSVSTVSGSWSTDTRKVERSTVLWIVGAGIACVLIIIIAAAASGRLGGGSSEQVAEQAAVNEVMTQLERRMDELEQTRTISSNAQTSVSEARLTVTLALLRARSAAQPVANDVTRAGSNAATTGIFVTLNAQAVAQQVERRRQDAQRLRNRDQSQTAPPAEPQTTPVPVHLAPILPPERPIPMPERPVQTADAGAEPGGGSTEPDRRRSRLPFQRN